jgi:hypothetical protein
MRTTSRDPDGWAPPPRGPRHAAPPFRVLAPLRLVARLRSWPFRVAPPGSAGPLGAAGPFSPAAAYGPATPTELRARRALRLFTAVGVCAAGLLLVVGFLVLAVSVGGPKQREPLVAGSALASDGRHAKSGRDGDHRSGQPSVPLRSVGYRSRPGHPVHAGSGRRDRPSGPSQPIASFAGYGDMVTHRFAVSANADWQIAWSYRCPASVPAGLLVVEDAAPGAVGAAISASGTAGHGDTWLDPDGRSHRLVVISTCSWTMKVIQNS